MKIAIVGAGLIGSAWAIAFARAGHDVAVFEADRGSRKRLPSRLCRLAEDSAVLAAGAGPSPLDRISIAQSLAEALAGAAFVQECGPEKLDLKQRLFAELDGMADPEAILASSTSSFGMSRIAGHLAGRRRMIVAHPATPPHLLPVVEVVPAPFTDPAVTERTMVFMREIGQKPVRVNAEMPGFVMNRLQGALLIEMFRAISSGAISPADADTLIRDGFGPRGAFLGPLEGGDLNAPGGIADYLGRYGFIFETQAAEAGAIEPVVTPAIIAELDRAMRERLPRPRAGADDLCEPAVCAQPEDVDAHRLQSDGRARATIRAGRRLSQGSSLSPADLRQVQRQ